MTERDHPVPLPPTDRRRRLSRRHFVSGGGAALATTGLVSIGIAGRELVTAESAQAAQATPVAPPAETMAGMAGHDTRVAFFNLHEAATVEALAARILPGTPEDPGAREAGVVNFIDRALAGPTLGYERKTYTQGPFLVVSEEPAPVEVTSAPDIYRKVLVAEAQVSRYGYQSVMTPQEMYRRGLTAVDAFAQSAFGGNFVDLSEADQDAVLTEMEADTATGFEGPSGRAFFTQLRNHTIEGMFSDPMYGGNRNLVGWELIGYPGAQRFYSAEDLVNPDFRREPQSLAELIETEGH